MQANNDNRYDNSPKQSGLPLVPIAAVALLVAAIGIWFFTNSTTDDSASAIASAAPIDSRQEKTKPKRELAPTPDIPVLETVSPEIDTTPDIAMLDETPLTLDDSDNALREYFAELENAPLLQQTLQGDHLVEVATAVVDAASQGVILRKLLPLPAPDEPFKVTKIDGELVMDPAGYDRYNRFASALAALNTQTLASGFHKFRPLLEEAYSALGYDAAELDNTVIRALDTIIAAPVIDEPINVVKDVATYNFSDTSLETLSPLAKQLLRMGPKNQSLLQRQAAALRATLLGVKTD